MTQPVALISHSDCGRHDTGWEHPEHVGRLVAIRARAVNTLGQTSPWRQITHTVSGRRAPVIWRQAAAPAGSSVQDGDEWVDTDDGNRRYVREAGAWVQVLVGTGALAAGAATVVLTALTVGPLDVTAGTTTANIPIGPYSSDAKVSVTCSFVATVNPIADVPQRAWVAYQLESFIGGTTAIHQTPTVLDTTSTTFGCTVTATFDYFAGVSSYVRLWADGQGKMGTATISDVRMRAEVIFR